MHNSSRILLPRESHFRLSCSWPLLSWTPHPPPFPCYFPALLYQYSIIWINKWHVWKCLSLNWIVTLGDCIFDIFFTSKPLRLWWERAVVIFGQNWTLPKQLQILHVHLFRCVKQCPAFLSLYVALFLRSNACKKCSFS